MPNLIDPGYTLYYDAERSYLSVAHLVRSEDNPAGLVLRHRINRLQDLTQSFTKLVEGKLLSEAEIQGLRAIVIDTVDRLAARARRELAAGTTNMKQDIWTIRDKITPSQRDWGEMSDLLARTFENFASWCEDQQIPLILLCHEAMKEDEVTKEVKGGPALNDMLLKEVRDNSDYLWRVWREEREVTVDGKKYPKNTHFARLSTSEKKMTKVRIPPNYSAKLVDQYPNPTLPEIFSLLGPFTPNVLTIFGPSGAGKTTLANSLSDPANFNGK